MGWCSSLSWWHLHLLQAQHKESNRDTQWTSGGVITDMYSKSHVILSHLWLVSTGWLGFLLPCNDEDWTASGCLVSEITDEHPGVSLSEESNLHLMKTATTTSKLLKDHNYRHVLSPLDTATSMHNVMIFNSMLAESTTARRQNWVDFIEMKK